MTTISAIFNAFAPESLERSPNLPTSHHKVISAIQHCRSGPDGHRLSSATAVANTTASIMPVAIATARSVSIIQPSSGSITTLTHSFPAPTAS